MAVKKIKISELPVVSSLVGLYTIGVDAANKSAKVSLEWLKTAYDNVTTAINNANSATGAANTAASNANTAAGAANTAAGNANTATAKAQSVSDHPGYIGSDYHVYTWNYATATYNKTDTVLRPEGFSIYKTYASIAAMTADTANVNEGKFVLINTGSVEDADTAKLYVKGTTAFEYLVDMSGAIGFTGKTPQFSALAQTGEVGTDVVITQQEDGTDANGNPKYKLTFKIPRGSSGVALQDSEPTDPTVNVWIDPTGESNTLVVDTITMDESITAPANVSGDVNGSALKKIRSLYRRCLAKYLGNGEMAICYLQNDCSNFYHDGSAALLDGTEGDVMVFRPDYAHYFNRLDADRSSISFSLLPENGLWKSVESCLIGAYEACAVNNKLYSRSGVASAGNISQTNFKAYARARGTGYQIIDYDMHKEAAILFYALYGTRNCQAVCGSGTSAYDKATGQTNGIGNADTTTTNGNSMSINFLGLENFWGNKYEWLDNVLYNPDSSSLGVWVITDTVTGEIRRVQGIAPTNGWIWPKRMVLGDNLDILVSEGGLSDTTGYCDGQYLSSALSHVVLRSYSYSYSYGGVAYADASSDASGTYAYIGSRLAFRGKITVYESVEAFKALSVAN